MKKILLFFIISILTNCTGSNYNYFNGTFEEAKKIAGSKLIFIKFYTNT
tara:strand:+ start:553 stop:699 length:147 start_codon:yes stop_codon:yes gene_type:complete